MNLIRCTDPEITHSDMVYAMIGLLCLGKADYQAIEPFTGDEFFTQAIGIVRCPSGPALRQRLDGVKGAFDSILREESADLIACTALRSQLISTTCGQFLPLDIDVCRFDNSKTKTQGMSRTYKGFDGFWKSQHKLSYLALWVAAPRGSTFAEHIFTSPAMKPTTSCCQQS